MTASAELWRIEAAAVRAWPALETTGIDGWLWRWSGGGSHRVNSVSTLRYAGPDMEASIEEAEARYRACEGRPQFQICGVSEPEGLDAALARRGYAVVAPVLTLAKPVGAAAVEPEGAACSGDPDAGWLAVYASVIDEARSRVASAILAQVPQPRVFVTVLGAEGAISTCLGVLAGGLACIECVATRSEARRQGGALRALSAVEAWAVRQGAGTLFLQVAAENHAATALYRKLGFTEAGRLHYRVREP